MRKLLLLAMLYTGVAQAQIEHISIGFGEMDFPSIQLADSSKGQVAYLAVGDEVSGGMLFLGGDSRITYGGEQYGSGMIGLAGFRDLEIYPWLKVGVFAGIVGFQTYKRDNDAINRRVFSGTPLPRLKNTNIQPYGGVRLSVSFVEFQWAPASNMMTIGFVLR